ncbi:MAG: glutamate synthase [Gemmatimonadales bacterium]
MFRELETREAIFDLPARKFVLGDARHDLSVRFHDHVAATPFGPAAGPSTQLAQNIVLSWLAGGRIIELKTVQVRDDLVIPRPCIDMQTIGYNVEWSQELKLEQSLEEYVKAALLIRMLVASGRLPFAAGFDRTVFDMSVGYDLAGIRSERVQAFLAGMADATPILERLRREIPAELGYLRDVEVPTRLSDTLTLSTFHGCPPDEIERIVDFLLRVRHLSCMIKLNPTLLGKEELHGLLHDRLGYTELKVPDAAFERDTKWEQAVNFTGRLGDTAASLGLGLGVKFTNTLIVGNHRTFFPAGEREMYLSGPPLHVLAMHLVRRFRRSFGDRYPISFSAGIERANFPDAVVLGLVPVTACSDLLKPGGYARGFGCFEELAMRMDAAGAATVDDYIRAYSEGPADLAAAKLHNTERYVERVAADPRYRAEKNRRVPRKIGRRLQLFDCVSCDKCIAVCPNDANFAIALPKGEPRQFINFADFCNDCGNCDVFCPEDGGPYVLKPRVFVDRARWAADAPRDAILIEADAVTGRFGGAVYRGDEPSLYADTLNQLREALLAPNEVNYVSASF